MQRHNPTWSTSMHASTGSPNTVRAKIGGQGRRRQAGAVPTSDGSRCYATTIPTIGAFKLALLSEPMTGGLRNLKTRYRRRRTPASANRCDNRPRCSPWSCRAWGRGTSCWLLGLQQLVPLSPTRVPPHQRRTFARHPFFVVLAAPRTRARGTVAQGDRYDGGPASCWRASPEASLPRDDLGTKGG
jgi:hypothetical protein